MTLQECYSKLNGNYDDALARLMNDALVTRFILKFPGDPSMDSLRQAIAQGNITDAFRAVHTLKGVAANLAFTQLFKDASALTEQIRDCVSSPDPVLLQNVENSYKQVIDTLAEFAASRG